MTGISTNSCISISSKLIQVKDCVGIEEHQDLKSNFLFAIPTTNFISVNLELDEKTKLEVYDIFGRLLTNILEQTKMDVKTLKEGKYLLHVEWANGDSCTDSEKKSLRKIIVTELITTWAHFC